MRCEREWSFFFSYTGYARLTVFCVAANVYLFNSVRGLLSVWFLSLWERGKKGCIEKILNILYKALYYQWETRARKKWKEVVDFCLLICDTRNVLLKIQINPTRQLIRNLKVIAT